MSRLKLLPLVDQVVKFKRSSREDMAIFQFNNRTINYHVAVAPFGHDLLLLQDEKCNQDVWAEVIADLQTEPVAGGRGITIESNIEDGDFLSRFIGTLGLHALHVVAFGSAVKPASELQKSQPDNFKNTLFYPHGGPKGEILVRAIREFVNL